jgi:hypothetical protein
MICRGAQAALAGLAGRGAMASRRLPYLGAASAPVALPRLHVPCRRPDARDARPQPGSALFWAGQD